MFLESAHTVGSINVTSGKKTHTCLASTVCGSSRNVDYFSSRLVQDVFFSTMF